MTPPTPKYIEHNGQFFRRHRGAWQFTANPKGGIWHYSVESDYEAWLDKVEFLAAERDAAETLVSAQNDVLVALRNERDWWEHRAEVAERENGEALAMLAFTGETSLWQAAAATRAKLAEAEKDAARLDWMADDPPFDGLGDHDLYECWHMVAHENGREEATQDDKRKAFRRLLDHARAAATAQGE